MVEIQSEGCHARTLSDPRSMRTGLISPAVLTLHFTTPVTSTNTCPSHLPCALPPPLARLLNLRARFDPGSMRSWITPRIAEATTPAPRECGDTARARRPNCTDAGPLPPNTACRYRRAAHSDGSPGPVRFAIGRLAKTRKVRCRVSLAVSPLSDGRGPCARLT